MGALGAGLIGSGLGSLLGGLFGSTPSAPDYSGLIQQAQNNYQQQAQLAQGLPGQIAALFPAYQQGQNAAGTAYQNAMNQAQNQLVQNTSQLYNPNGPAVQAAEAANQQQAYSNVNSSQNAVRQALAATGGFQRGNAGVQLAQPVLQAANTAALGGQQIQAQNLARGQGAMQNALQTVAQMSDQQAQQIFGMSANQAATILQYGTQAQQQSLADLLQAGSNENSQILGAMNAQNQANYSQSAAQAQLQNQMLAGLGNLGGGLAAGFGQGGSSGGGFAMPATGSLGSLQGSTGGYGFLQGGGLAGEGF
jgi:hypothetical protein